MENNMTLNQNETNPAVLWRAILELQEQVKGPDGFETWKDAALAERLKRVELEKATVDKNWYEKALYLINTAMTLEKGSGTLHSSKVLAWDKVKEHLKKRTNIEGVSVKTEPDLAEAKPTDAEILILRGLLALLGCHNGESGPTNLRYYVRSEFEPSFRALLKSKKSS